MECQDEFESDEEGQKLTAAINEHLPAEVSSLLERAKAQNFSGFPAACRGVTYQSLYSVSHSVLQPELRLVSSGIGYCLSAAMHMCVGREKGTR